MGEDKATTDVLPTTGSEVTVFVENTLKQIKKGVKGGKGYIHGMIEFDLEITERKGAEGKVGFKQFIMVGGKKEGETSQKVKFKVDPGDS